MTVNEALIVCKILQSHGFGDYKMTVETGYSTLGTCPDEFDEDKKFINMEAYKTKLRNGEEHWVTSSDLVQVCNEIEEALKCMNNKGDN